MSGPIVEVVSALFLDGHGNVYLQRRPEGNRCPGMWETPSGKVEDGEDHRDKIEAAMRRQRYRTGERS